MRQMGTGEHRGSVAATGLICVSAALLVLATVLPCAAQVPPGTVSDSRIHHAGEIWLGITNYGQIGGQRHALVDMEDLNIYWQPSLEFPGGSRHEFLWAGGLLFGCIRDLDTLVSTVDGAGGFAREFNSYQPILETSSHASSPLYHPDAISEQQFYAVYTDTTALPNNPSYYDELERRPHRPIGLEVHQTSHAWSSRFAKRLIIFDTWIINISTDTLRRSCVGLMVDADIYHRDLAGGGASDDLCGFLDSARTGPKPYWWSTRPRILEEHNIIWAADNDGDPDRGTFTSLSSTAAMGMKILRTPGNAKFSFNWWAGFGDRSWGPRAARDQLGHARSLGQPIGDRGLYHMMANGEIDYDQIESALDFSNQGWAVPLANRDRRNQIAGGDDPKFIISCGPLPDILPGDSIPFTYALVTGSDFHIDPGNHLQNFDPESPERFLSGLDFTDLMTSARWAEWIFDTPGVDTDGDGNAGRAHSVNCRNWRGSWLCEHVWYKGDGVPDWSGPQPPQAPEITVTTRPRGATIRWSGAVSELERDPLSGRRDFEGYRLYVARINAADHYALIASWDRPDDFVRFDYFPRFTDWRRRSHPEVWKQTSYPATTVEWQEILGKPDFDPRDYAERAIETAYIDTTLDTTRDPRGRILQIEPREQYSYWEPVDANQGNTYWDGTWWQDNIIQQIDVRDTVIADDTLTYGVYEATITNLMGGDPIYIGLTTFDQGDYENNLDAQESSPQANSEYVFQIYSADIVADSGLKVAVYPNPYKSRYRGRDGNWTNYYAEGFEASGLPTWSPLDRRIWFAHLPDTAMVRIYSLDGDLIRELHHPDPMFSPYNSAMYWDLISRNQQAVRSGIYIYRIDSRLPVQMGKLVIIR